MGAVGVLKVAYQDLVASHSKAGTLDMQFAGIHRMGTSDLGASVLGASLHFTGDLSTMKDDVLEQLGAENESTGPDDTRPAIIRPLAGSIAHPGRHRTRRLTK